MSIRSSVRALGLRVFDINNLTSSYQPIDPDGIEKVALLLRLSNVSNRGVFISYDGTTDHDFLDRDNVLQLSLQENASRYHSTAGLSRGTKIYVKGNSGVGFLYLSIYCQ